MRTGVWLLAVLAFAGCVKKASYIANDRGGFTLLTRAQTIDQAVTRFNRRATDLCGPGAYQLGDPNVMAQGYTGSGFTAGSDLTLKIDVICR